MLVLMWENMVFVPLFRVSISVVVVHWSKSIIPICGLVLLSLSWLRTFYILGRFMLVASRLEGLLTSTTVFSSSITWWWI